MKFIITESQLQELFQPEFSSEFFNLLANKIEVDEIDLESTPEPFVVIYVCDKPKLLSSSINKLVTDIVLCYGDKFPNIPNESKRLTAKNVIKRLKSEYYF